jgi:hypothetical protein
LLDSLPCLFYVLRLRVGLAYAESEREFAIELGVRQVEIAAGIQAIH